MTEAEVKKRSPSLNAPVDTVGKNIDPTKKLLIWLFKTNSPRLSLRQNTKGKNRFVWRQFRLAYIDDAEQPYAMCCNCENFVKYSGRTGTGGLVRHHCYREILANFEHYDIQDEAETKQPNPPKNDVRTHGRPEIEDLIQKNSSRIGYIPNYKGKSDVWTQFDIITVDNEAVNFAACKLCRSIVTYVSRTGTGGMTRHKCQKLKRAHTPDSPLLAEDLAKKVKQEIEECQEPSSSPPPEPNLAELQLKAFSQILQANLQTFTGEMESRSSPVPPRPPPPSREPPEDVVRRHYVGLLRRSLDVFHAMRNDAFFDLAQTLVNIGAEYGKIDIRHVLLDAADLNEVFETD